MSKIDVLSLGGLNENGKNLYTISVDERIIIFDCGLKFATDKMYGIDYIIPDYSYLKEHKDKIVGVFISHAHFENMGSLTDLVREIPDIDVYCTKFASKILEFECADDLVEVKNLHVIEAHKKIEFGDFSIFPFSVTHSAPESLGYAVNTKDGAIVYMGDFVIDPTMKEPYEMDLGKLAYIGKQGVLLLMAESIFSTKKGFTAPNHKLDKFFESVVDRNEGRIIISLLSLHIHTIQEIFDSIVGTNRRVVIMGKKLHSIINMCIKEGYLNVSDGVIGDLTNLKDKNSIVIISNDRENPYNNLSRIVNGYDKFIILDESDTVCFAEPSYDAYETTVVKLMNDIAVKGANIETVPKDKSVRQHASSEDLMLLIRLFNPKYYMPIKGEYRYQVENGNLAYNVGMSKDNILLKQNGDITTFINGNIKDNFEHIFVDDILIDGKSSSDIGELVLKDREMLGKDGLVLISVLIDKKTKQIKVGPEILTRGFIYVRDNLELIEQIKEKSLEIIAKNTFDKYVDYAKVRNEIREVLGTFLYKKTECRPVILTVLQEV